VTRLSANQIAPPTLKCGLRSLGVTCWHGKCLVRGANVKPLRAENIDRRSKTNAVSHRWWSLGGSTGWTAPAPVVGAWSLDSSSDVQHYGVKLPQWIYQNYYRSTVSTASSANPSVQWGHVGWGSPRFVVRPRVDRKKTPHVCTYNRCQDKAASSTIQTEHVLLRMTRRRTDRSKLVKTKCTIERATIHE